MSGRTRIGVIGCGLIAQVMHLPYLEELADRFEIAAVCDVREEVATACAARYGAPRAFSRWQDLLEQPLDAVLIASSGDHAPIAIAAAQAGLHVLVEKPMALCSRDAEAMVTAADAAGVQLMVGTMKRYDPAYQRLAELLADTDDVRLIRVTTLESPFEPYVAHYPLVDGAPPDPGLMAEIDRGESAALDAAIGDTDEDTRWCFRWLMLDSLVHEFNVLQGLLGAPDEVRSAALGRQNVGVHLRFGAAECHLAWVDLPGIARYHQEFAFYAPQQRLTLALPSPFLRSAPSRLIVEGGDAGTGHSWQRDEIIDYDEAFKRELVAFSDCIRSGRQPVTSGPDGLRDMYLMEAVVRAHVTRSPAIPTPVQVPAPANGSPISPTPTGGVQ